MGIETALILATVAAVGGKVAGGMAANSAAKTEAGLMDQQAALGREESITSAENLARDRRQFLNAQKLAFLKNGVSLEGSPLLVLEDTRAYAQREVDATIKRGQAQYNLTRAQAQLTRNKGRAALIGGITDGIGTAASMGMSMNNAGMFNSTKKVP